MLSLKNLDTKYKPLWKENKKTQEHLRCKMAKRDKILDDYNQMQKKYLPFPDRLELHILRIDIDTARKEESKTSKQMDSVFHVNRANTTYKKIDAKGRRAIEREPCVICFETHDAKQLTTTNCRHTFCRPCFSKVLETNYFDDKEVSCPYCRNDKITLTRYYK
jgi:hypothetical protein